MASQVWVKMLTRGPDGVETPGSIRKVDAEKAKGLFADGDAELAPMPEGESKEVPAKGKASSKTRQKRSSGRSK